MIVRSHCTWSYDVVILCSTHLNISYMDNDNDTRRQIRIWSSCLIRCENLTPGRAESVPNTTGTFIILSDRSELSTKIYRYSKYRSETEERPKIRTPPNKPPQQTTSTSSTGTATSITTAINHLRQRYRTVCSFVP